MCAIYEINSIRDDTKIINLHSCLKHVPLCNGLCCVFFFISHCKKYTKQKKLWCKQKSSRFSFPLHNACEFFLAKIFIVVIRELLKKRMNNHFSSPFCNLRMPRKIPRKILTVESAIVQTAFLRFIDSKLLESLQSAS